MAAIARTTTLLSLCMAFHLTPVVATESVVTPHDGVALRQVLSSFRKFLGPVRSLDEEALQPYLKYPAIELPKVSASGPNGPQMAVTVFALDPLQRSKQIFISNPMRPADLFGFEGATGAPLVGFSPVTPTGPWAGMPLITAIAVGPGTSANPNNLPTIPSYLLFDSHGTGITPSLNTMRLLDASGQTLWDGPSANPQYGPFPYPVTTFGTMTEDGAQDAIFLLDEEDFNARGRSARNGNVLWSSPNFFSQQLNASAIIDAAAGPAGASFVYCRGELDCLLEKHNVATGAVVWTSYMGGAHIYPFVAVGDINGLPGEEVVVIGRQESSPFHALVHVVDGSSGNVLWSHSLEDSAGWAPAATLADLDGDHLPEIIVQTSLYLNAIKYMTGSLPNWPVVPWGSPARSEAVVGDLDGDPEMEIVLVSYELGSGTYGILDIFDQNGQRQFFPGAIRMKFGMGMTPAIADVDGDGHNELILGSTFLNSYVEPLLMPSLWVLDFSRASPTTKHGAIQWAQYAADPQRTARALSANAEIRISPTMFVEHVNPGDAITVGLAIRNSGGADLSWQLAGADAPPEVCLDGGAPEWVALSRDSGVLSAGHDEIIDVYIDAGALQTGMHETSVCIASNDGSHPLLSIPLLLEVTDVGHQVTVIEWPGGTISPITTQRVANAARLRIHPRPEPGYILVSVTGCDGNMIGNDFITAEIIQDCTLEAKFRTTQLLFADGFENDQGRRRAQ